jgi:hypothetical protein
MVFTCRCLVNAINDGHCCPITSERWLHGVQTQGKPFPVLSCVCRVAVDDVIPATAYLLVAFEVFALDVARCLLGGLYAQVIGFPSPLVCGGVIHSKLHSEDGNHGEHYGRQDRPGEHTYTSTGYRPGPLQGPHSDLAKADAAELNRLQYSVYDLCQHGVLYNLDLGYSRQRWTCMIDDASSSII